LPSDATHLIKFSQITKRLNWKPSVTSISRACKKDVDRWVSHVENHEGKHRDDNIKAWESTLKANKSKSITTCGATDQESLKNLRDAVFAYMDKIGDSALDDIKKRADIFHKSPDGGPVAPLDCSVC
jgi:hypothetical protein